MAYTIPARISKKGKPIPEIIVDDEFKGVVSAYEPYPAGNGLYPTILVGGKQVRLHRHLWFLKHGWNPVELDHTNEDKLDCRLENLRPATRSLNCTNKSRKKKASDLPMGVTRQFIGGNGTPLKRQYVATFRRKYLGHFSTPEEASASYLAAKTRALAVESDPCA